jgi:hypothetical protein
MEQSKFKIYKIIFSLNVFFHRRDFRLHRVDPTTKQVVANPIKWVEMNGTEIVWRNLQIYIVISVIYLVTYW